MNKNVGGKDKLARNTRTMVYRESHPPGRERGANALVGWGSPVKWCEDNPGKIAGEGCGKIRERRASSALRIRYRGVVTECRISTLEERKKFVVNGISELRLRDYVLVSHRELAYGHQIIMSLVRVRRKCQRKVLIIRRRCLV